MKRLTICLGALLGAALLTTTTLGVAVADPKPRPYLCKNPTIFANADGSAQTIHGTDGPDVIAGGHGSDRIFGHGGDDLICGNKGSDIVHGNRGGDRVQGFRGSDELYGDRGKDRAGGGYGNDLCRAEREKGCER